MQTKRSIVFATNNKHKLDEVRAILVNRFNIISLSEIKCNDEIDETAETLEGNALLKAQYIHEKYGFDCFADDTGLEVEALNGAPGVRSARFAGEDCIASENVKKLLSEMIHADNRKAQFRTVIALILNGKEFFFDGCITGIITNSPLGENGFGYDPVFQPDGYVQTFAELGSDEKNKISHRALAVQKLSDFLLSEA